MEIILIRHGKSECLHAPGLRLADYMDWLQKYDELGIIPSSSKHFKKAQQDIFKADHVLTSHLNRARKSAALLRPDLQAIPHEIFNEVNFRPPFLTNWKLHSSLWTLMMGAFWYWGWIKEHESKYQARKRAVQAVDLLVKHSQSGTVALIGHGFINFFIYKELKSRGWKTSNHLNNKNWGVTRLSK